MMKQYFIDHPFEDLVPPTDQYTTDTDKNGIILITYPARNLNNVYNPTIIALFALSQYNDFITHSEDQHKKTFLTHAAWLAETLVDKGAYGVWHYNFPWTSPGYRCTPPWVSSMAQGLGISVLLRAHSLTGDPLYMNPAEKAAASFHVPVSQGGVLSIDSHGDPWYEEFACQKSAHVLNGFIFALLGIHELYLYTKDEKMKNLFDKGVNTVKTHLTDFDLNLLFFKWSRYDDHLLFYSGEKYHNIHLKQLAELYNITKEDIFFKYLKKWETYTSIYGSGPPHLLFKLIYRIYTRFKNFI